jgi:hypothetical protein
LNIAIGWGISSRIPSMPTFACVRILDQFDEEEKKWYHHWSVYYGPVLVFILGVLMRIMHWPGANLILVLGLAGTFIRSTIFFFIKKQSPVNWIYFFARQIFTVIIAMHLAYGPFGIGNTMLIVAFTIFTLAAIIKLFEKKKGKDDPGQEPEDY